MSNEQDSPNVDERRPVPGYEGRYEVSRSGDVWTLSTRGKARTARGDGRLKPMPNRSPGYSYAVFQVKLWKSGRYTTFNVARLVLTVFDSPPPADTSDAIHRDGDPANNQLTNLYWGTDAEIVADIMQRGNHAQASKTECSRGHKYDDHNTRLYRRRNCTLQRKCRECDRLDKQAQRPGPKVYLEGQLSDALCACGCGQRAPRRARYRMGHATRGRRHSKAAS